MKDLAIVCFSCDKDEEMWPIFSICLNKYWPNHPRVYLLTETKTSPIIDTICYNYPLNKWTTRIIKSLNDIKENKVVFICDDVFLNDYVNIDKLKDCLKILDKEPKAAYINFEMSFNYYDVFCQYNGFKKKTKDSDFRLSLLCGIWDKKKLIDILSNKEGSPWDVEDSGDILKYDAYIVSDKKVLSWFRDGRAQYAACHNGKWSKDLPDFLKKEGLTMDLEKKGFY